MHILYVVINTVTVRKPLYYNKIALYCDKL